MKKIIYLLLPFAIMACGNAEKHSDVSNSTSKKELLRTIHYDSQHFVINEEYDEYLMSDTQIINLACSMIGKSTSEVQNVSLISSEHFLPVLEQLYYNIESNTTIWTYLATDIIVPSISIAVVNFTTHVC